MQNKLRALVQKLSRDQRGLSTVEYVVLLVLIVVMAVALWNLFGDMLAGKLGDAADEFDQEVQTTQQGSNNDIAESGNDFTHD
jgi:Flp pilus assembly pilin Flp